MQQKTFDLKKLNGTNGFTIFLKVGSDLGQKVNSAGDINGDGLTDIALISPSGITSRAIYVIFGKRDKFPESFDLSGLDGHNGFKIPLPKRKSATPVDSVNTAGDLNGDGLEDMVVGVPSTDDFSELGVSYVIFGQRTPFPVQFNLTQLNGKNGFVIPGVWNGYRGWLGRSVGNAGDINGDGLTDIVLGDYDNSYIIFGQRDGYRSSFDLRSLNGTNGFSVPDINGSNSLGIAVSGVGDINGDGLADVALGAHFNNDLPKREIPGTAYVIFGQANQFPAIFDLTLLDGNNGFSLQGINNGDQFGKSITGIGDINGDGLADMAIGALVGGSSRNGTSYVIFGQANGFPAQFKLTALNGINGFKVSGLVTDASSIPMSGGGDVNGDGIDDLLLGSPFSQSWKGVDYVIFGQRNRFSAELDLNSLDGSNGFNVPGLMERDYLGISVRLGGDFNGDGLADIMLGASGANGGEGICYILFGSVPSILYPPLILNQPIPQLINVNQPFHFTFNATDIFSNPQDYPLNFSLQPEKNAILPSWVQFEAGNSTIPLTFFGTAPTAGHTRLALLAQNAWNQTVKTPVDILAVPQANSAFELATYSLSGALGFGMLMGLGYGIYKAYQRCKSSHSGYESLGEMNPKPV